MFSGSCVALVTPFKNGKVDEDKLRDLVEFHIANGTSAILPCGTTGESATLTHEEHGRVIEVVVNAARKRIKVIAGAGSNSTQEAIGLVRHAKKVEADGVLVIVPYYNKPTQKGMFEHFTAVAKAADIPIIIYNIPGRTGVNMLPATVIQTARANKNIIGIKESTGNIDQTTEIVAVLGDSFDVLSGDDSLTLPIMACGGKGVISVAANIVPKDIAAMCKAWEYGNTKSALQYHLKLYPLIKALFIETNPIPLKTAMEMMELCSAEMRLPMCSMEEANRAKLKSALESYGLLSKQEVAATA